MNIVYRLLAVTLLVGQSAVLCEAQAEAEGKVEAVTSLTIVAPESGCKIVAGETVKIIAVAHQGENISLVAFTYDGRGIGADNEAPFEAEWDTRALPAGECTIKAVAYLVSGATVEAPPVVVTVRAEEVDAPVEVSDKGAVSPPEPVLLREGTPVLLKTINELRSGRTPQGSTVTLEVVRDVTASDGRILVTYGSKATGTITRSKKRGMFGKSGKLEFSIDSAMAVDGTHVPLRAQEIRTSGKSNEGVVVASALLLTVFAVFIHGRDVVVPPGTEISAYVDRTVEIERPEPAIGAPRGEPMETAEVLDPLPGTAISYGEELAVSLDMSPSSKVVKVQLFLDDKMVKEQSKGKVTGAFSLRKLSLGEHKIRAEVHFLSGRVVRTKQLSVTVE